VTEQDIEAAARRAYEMALKKLALYGVADTWLSASEDLKDRWRAVARSVFDPVWHAEQTVFAEA